MRPMSRALALVVPFVLAPTLHAQSAAWTAVLDGKEAPAPAIEMGDDAVVRAILDEGKNRNRVMDHLTHLSTVIGARLTGSTALQQANEWARDQFTSFGLSNARLEQWGEIAVRFDRGPSSGRLLLRRERTARGAAGPTVEYEPVRDLELSWLAWQAGTNGPVRGPVVKEPQNAEEFLAVQPRLKGAWVLLKAPPPIGQRGVRTALGTRYEVRRDARRKVAEGAAPSSLSVVERMALEPVAGYISTTRDERVWTGAVPGWRTLDFDTIPRDAHVVIRGSDYDFLNSRVADGEPIEAEFDLQATFTRGPIPVYNTIAEIPGTQKPEEVVIISAHLDSWNGPGSQGTTDNGTGSAVTIEAARILMAVGAKPTRTICFILWTGEEQGLLGARAYVEKHKDELDKISAVFVDDGGTNSQGGLPAAENMVEMLAAATAPINNQFYSETDKKHLNVNVRNTGPRIESHGSSDHAAFNAVGVPGFFWDEVGRADYGHGWHTQHDRIDLAIPEYLQQSATNSAIVAYRLACAPTLLPRAEPPAPSGEQPRRRRGQPQGEAPSQSPNP
ncbi:MAG: M20/M25/M40 family metallo-hydrolase [Planctomycetota bacterium]|nr:M20/M25/M40 family metallo-hydrolase [Planctomycetota bacterium]